MEATPATTTQGAPTMQTIVTTVTTAQLAAAQGGTGGYGDLVTVECPTDYDASTITAEDIINDPAITMIED